MLILLRFTGELSIKSHQVRNRFVHKLIYNINCALQEQLQKNEYQLINLHDRLLLNTLKNFDYSILSKIFGISSYSIIEYTCEPKLDLIIKTALDNYSHILKGKSFAIRAKRYNVGDFSSHDIEIQLGDALRHYAKKVDLTNPDVTIHLEIRPQGTFFYQHKTPGAEGLPLGTQGKLLCLFSGGFDSAVASWFMMKRGVACDFVFFNLASSAYENSVLSVLHNLITNWAYGENPKMYILDFLPIVYEIKTKIPSRYAQVVLKRAMYKVASILAKQYSYPALVTGESLGQVSSQTLYNLCAIEDCAQVPVFRPLVGLDKNEIIGFSKKIGTFDLSSQVKEYCRIAPKHVVTQAVPSRVKEIELNLDSTVFDQVLGTLKILDVRHLNFQSLDCSHIFTDHIDSSDIVIDCRERALYDMWHYPNAIHIDFSALKQKYQSLDKDKRYVIYCTHGLESAIIAQKMQENGYNAFSFYGGVNKLKKHIIN